MHIIIQTNIHRLSYPDNPDGNISQYILYLHIYFLLFYIGLNIRGGHMSSEDWSLYSGRSGSV